MRVRRTTRTLALSVMGTVLFLFGATVSRAQVGCRTANCNAPATPPAQCVNRASPYTMSVMATALQTFVPQNPKIEPADCIAWVESGSLVHSSSADNCNDTGTTCTTVDTTCDFDSGNITSTATQEICFYDTLVFPAGAAEGFYCRVHSNPTHTIGAMFGTINVTTPINVTLGKSGNDVVLTWTGGGITGDVTYKVVRNLVGDPLFTVGANTVTGNPDGSTSGTTFTELGALSDPANHYYLIRNRQINE